MGFMQSLREAWQRNDSLVCVGVDPEPARFPAHLRAKPDAVFVFCAAIVDATADLVCDMPLLVPGVGAQGGDVATVLAAGALADGTGLIVSSSRAILYAGGGADFAQAARAAAVALRDTINRHRPAAIARP